MKKDFGKQGRLRLGQAAYRKLCGEVLKRDGWQCQNCGARNQLQVHHRQFRSHGGGDSDENLITLCIHCHEAVHRPTKLWYVRSGSRVRKLARRYGDCQPACSEERTN